MTTPEFKHLTIEHSAEIAWLGRQLNPDLSIEQLTEYITKMFEFKNYHCFGLYLNGQLLGITSGWETVRFYSGKQLEVDNVIIDAGYQSGGLGAQFFEFIETWAKENNYKTIELNTYVQNSRSHKFYFKLGYSILGFHFQKHI
jgi:GNAT superfamily N-acetyltransferase